MVPSDVGARIRAARKQCGLTQHDLADRVMVKQSTVSGYESGYAYPSDRTLRDIANRCGVRYEWLLTGEGEMLADDDALAAVMRAMAGQSDAKKRLLQIIAEMPDGLADAMIAYMEQRQAAKK